MQGFFHRRRARAAAILSVVAILALTLLVAAFPYTLLRPTLERRLTERFGRPVRIERLARVGRFGFTPVVAIAGLTIPQPGWAGTGDFIRLERAQMRFSVWPLLVGSFRPQGIVVSGLHATLVRAADGRRNWVRPGGGERNGGGGMRDLAGLTIRDSTVDYRDAKRDRRVVARIAADASGVRLDGSGRIHGVPVEVAFAGPAIGGSARPWPFTASIDGAQLAMRARGTMDRPLDPRAMTIDLTARAADLKLIDAVIEAGLFRTQPVTLTAHVRRDAPRWTVTALRGTVGRSALTGGLTVDKVAGRSKIGGMVRFARLDFDDLSSDEGIARGAALERRIGPKLVPALRVDLSKIDHTDGRLRFAVDRVLSRQGPPAIRTMRGVATMDRQLLTVSPLTLTLARGAVTGRVVVDQRGDRPIPAVTLDLSLRNSSVPALVGGEGQFTGRVDARGRLRGIGTTLREAVGRSSGRVGFVIRDGDLPERIAVALGFDALRAAFASKEDRAGLRCVVAGLDVRNGRGRTDPLLVDTTESRLDGTGTVTFPQETLAISLTGMPKHGGGLRLPGAVLATGTLKAPAIYVPPKVKSVGNVLKAIGHAIRGDQGPLATDADCGGLAARALR